MRGITRTRSNNALVKSAGGGTEGDVSTSVKYVLDLFIAAYFQFDTKVKAQGCGGRGGERHSIPPPLCESESLGGRLCVGFTGQISFVIFWGNFVEARRVEEKLLVFNSF